MTNNPYEAPRAEVADYLPPESDSVSLADAPQGLPAGRGLEWIKQGWGLFTQNPGLWIGINLVLLGIILAAAMIPIVGFIAQNVLYPVLGAGMMFGCDALWRGKPLRFDHLFAGFSRNSKQLFLLGAIYCGGILAVMLIAFVPTIGLVGGMAFMGNGDPDALAAVFGLPILIGLLIYLMLLMPLLMAIWFAPVLVMLNDVPAVDALRMSFFGCLKNILPFLIYGLVGLGLAILATLPLLLGWLVLMPWLVTSNYCAYREIFYRG
jgi:hypothetical protein